MVNWKDFKFMPRGGARPGSGRKPGQTDGLRLAGQLAARPYAEKALRTLVGLLTSPNDTVKLGAANSILDRAYGKASQPITGKDGGPLEIEHSVKDDAERFTNAIAGLVARAAEDGASFASH